MNLQPTFRSGDLRVEPLRADHLECLYEAAADPLIWAQHPTPTRYQRAVFETYFKGALESKGALVVVQISTGDTLGCSRYYGFSAQSDSVTIGYTFFTRASWGTGVNPRVKRLMLDHAFVHVGRVRFEVGAENRRSQLAMERLGAHRVPEPNVSDSLLLKVEYEITRDAWLAERRDKRDAGDDGIESGM